MLVNLAYLLDRPTGTTAYALNLLPYLQPLAPTYLATAASGLNREQYVTVPNDMTQGSLGHLRRLWWTQFQLPKLIQQQSNLASGSASEFISKSARRSASKSVGKAATRSETKFSIQATRSELLFSPIPEVPLAMRSAHRCRSVVTFHDLIPLRFPEMFGAIKYYYRYYVPQVLAQAEQIICNSEATARDVVDFYGISARKLVSIPLAYDARHFQPTAAKPQLPGADSLMARPYFLMIGRHTPYKNIGAAIAAMTHLPDCTLLIAGPSDSRYTPRLQALAHELGISIQFLSYVPYEQLPALISHALALVFPSLWEGFGLPVLEAMACGTPVITSNLASLPEVAGDAAYLVDPTSAEAIAKAMYELAHDSLMRQQLSAAGQQRVKHFSWAKTGQATVEVLRRYL
jgi:glycosyltransferase involved in cell wall biosynthesis